MQDNRAVQNYEPELINVRRNPYLLDYEEQRRGTVQDRHRVQGRHQMQGQRTAQSQYIRQSARRESPGQMYRNGTEGGRQPRSTYRQETGRPVERMGQPRPSYRQKTGRPAERMGQPRPSYGQETGRPVRRTGEVQPIYRQGTGRPVRRTGEVQPIYGRDMRQTVGRSRAQSGLPDRQAMLKERRRRQLRRQKIAVGIWAVCIIAISGVLLLNRGSASAAEPVGTLNKDTQQQRQEALPSNASGTLIQGLPAEKFTAHPEWTENFLTPNEYSRPGEPLTEVKDVFVHYTANPGTSAAQNRSYFEQQKDTHMASVSAHFIIGYEGEIIQCVPLDEIAYAVAGRNYDSVSIECCYTAKDGSFTKETYDSLLSLLAWLTDVYNLDTDHILRHYDCGGKKCPVYYTENEDAWEQLKQDVKAYK
ncbi:MAG: N-acetylmuramoyl-L-alanine amidase [Acetatifactor muris]|nr:N-acetylmuramoyl-L-alanine amidase [Acetatifactor muris]